MSDTMELNTTEMATELTIAWLSNPNTRAEPSQVSAFLFDMKSAVDGMTSPAPVAAAEPEQAEGAVSVRKSLASKDHILSMIDGKPYRTLRRHLSTNGMTPESYRERFGLKADYPMVAESYSQARRDMAVKIGLGRKTGQKAPGKAPKAAKA